VKIAPLLGALVVAGFAWRRRRELEPTAVAGAALLVAGLLLYGSGLVHPPNLVDLIRNAGEALGPYTYVLVGALAFLETGAFIGLVAPGELAILVGGVIAGQGQIEVIPLIALVWACAVAGDVTSFFLGRRLGREFMVKHGRRVAITEERLVQVEGFVDKHGGKAIFLGRFVGLVRSIAPFLVGSTGMTLRRFLPYDVLGAGLWGSTFVLLGYVFWQSFDRVIKLAERGALALGVVIALAVGIAAAVRWLRVGENRRRARVWLDVQARRPVIAPVVRAGKPVARRLAGPGRFVWERLTPGDLGLELTTLLAGLAVGTFTVIAPAIRVQPGHVPRGDARALRTAIDLQNAAGVDVAKVVTTLGSLPVVCGLIVVTAIAVLVKRELLEGLTLVAGMGITYAAVHLIKTAEDRPRPAAGLVDASGSSFPSGHAAYAVAWLAVAVAAARVLPNLASRAAVLTGATLLVMAIALTRVYLRAHYLSDVVAGAALSAAIYSGCALIALVVTFVRHNARQ